MPLLPALELIVRFNTEISELPPRPVERGDLKTILAARRRLQSSEGMVLLYLIWQTSPFVHEVEPLAAPHVAAPLTMSRIAETLQQCMGRPPEPTGAWSRDRRAAARIVDAALLLELAKHSDTAPAGSRAVTGTRRLHDIMLRSISGIRT